MHFARNVVSAPRHEDMPVSACVHVRVLQYLLNVAIHFLKLMTL